MFDEVYGVDEGLMGGEGGEGQTWEMGVGIGEGDDSVVTMCHANQTTINVSRSESQSYKNRLLECLAFPFIRAEGMKAS